MSPDDRRVVLAAITPAGHDLAEGATAALNDGCFGMPGITSAQAAEMASMLRAVRVVAEDL
jgi:DNA-binding MarR family transcriptional regulator